MVLTLCFLQKNVYFENLLMFPSWVLLSDLHEDDGNSWNMWEKNLTKYHVG